MHLNLKANQLFAGRRLRNDELFGACFAVCRIGNVFGRAFAARGFNQLWFDLVGLCLMMANGWMKARQKAVDER